MRIVRVLGLVLAVIIGQAHAAEFTDRFSELNARDWYVAHYQFGHPHFDTDWEQGQVRLHDGLVLSLTPQSGAENRFKGASLRRHTPTGYGRYETEIQAARGDGVVTGFFTYTGPHYGSRHDEIDIELLGKNTRQLHIATFVDGKLWNKFIDLGFDAAEAPHRYAFEWTPDAIRWYVDDELVYEKHASSGPLPEKPGMLFANIWAADPSIKSWSGEITEGWSAQARVLSMAHRPQVD